MADAYLPNMSHNTTITPAQITQVGKLDLDFCPDKCELADGVDSALPLFLFR